jgi:hypothetical protein
MRILCPMSLCAAWMTVAASCGKPGQSPSPVTCVPTRLDSAWLAAGTVYRDCDVDRPARLLNPTVPTNYLPPADVIQRCLTALIYVVVDTHGTPELSTARIARTNAPEFARALLRTAQSWLFQPALKRGVPVRQVVAVGRSLILADAVSPSTCTP